MWPLIAVAFAEETGYVPRAVSTVRSSKRQAQLYALYKSGKGGRAAPPGSSAHEYGLALDVNIFEHPSGKAVGAFTREGKALYAELHRIARSYGLTDIMADAPDDPFHLQAPNWRRVAGR